MKNNTSGKLQKLTLAGAFAALTTVATMLIRIPTPTKGYINMGDVLVNLAAWFLGPVYGGAAAGIGSAMADLISGYTVYAPATLVIKAGMAVASALIFTRLAESSKPLFARIAGAVAAEAIMIAGYALFAGVLYGSFASVLLSVPENVVQGVFGAAVSVSLYELAGKRFVKPHTLG